MSYYATATELRTELNLDSTALPDTQADDIIETAEDLVDLALGFWPIDEVLGRKIDLTDPDLADWQIAKLQRATVKLAAQLYNQPELRADTQRYSSVSGPEFSFSNLQGSRFNRDTIVALNLSGLRRLTGRGTPVLKRRPANAWFQD